MNPEDSIFICGHQGLIGSAVLRRLRADGHHNLLLRGRKELDLTDGTAVDRFFTEMQPDYVVLAAGRVGGIAENLRYPADFIEENLAIELNVLRAPRHTGVKRLIFFASSCMYPRDCRQPMAENDLLSGQPEPSSLPYAMAKLAGVQMCLAYNRQEGKTRFIPLIPNSAFGPNDHFDPERGHVLAALMHRFHEAKSNALPSVTLWGSGTPRREFIHADDIATACLQLLDGDLSGLTLPVNVGTGQDHGIRELAQLIATVVGYTGKIEWDRSKPDGAPRKLLDSTRLQNWGWKPEVDFVQGLRSTYDAYVHQLWQ